MKRQKIRPVTVEDMMEMVLRDGMTESAVVQFFYNQDYQYYVDPLEPQHLPVPAAPPTLRSKKRK
jgi:hypothetical protein